MIWMGFSEWIELNIYLLLWLKIILNLFNKKKNYKKNLNKNKNYIFCISSFYYQFSFFKFI